jgi:hypothetical protein
MNAKKTKKTANILNIKYLGKGRAEKQNFLPLTALDFKVFNVI